MYLWEKAKDKSVCQLLLINIYDEIAEDDLSSEGRISVTPKRRFSRDGEVVVNNVFKEYV